MKQGISLKKTAYAAYAVAAVLFVIFSVYMLCFEKTVTFNSRGEPSFEEIKDYTKSEISAPDAPIGIKKEYRLTIPCFTAQAQVKATVSAPPHQAIGWLYRFPSLIRTKPLRLP